MSTYRHIANRKRVDALVANSHHAARLTVRTGTYADGEEFSEVVVKPFGPSWDGVTYMTLYDFHLGGLSQRQFDMLVDAKLDGFRCGVRAESDRRWDADSAKFKAELDASDARCDAYREEMAALVEATPYVAPLRRDALDMPALTPTEESAARGLLVLSQGFEVIS